MTRPRKQTVDYFPHSCNHGQTMFILEQRYGNDGYAFWFKLLELLGKAQGHYLDLEKIAALEFLASTTRVVPDICVEILNLLARLEAIDPELWESKIIWSDNFVNGITDAYRNRVLETPMRPDNLRKKPPISPVSDGDNPQIKLKESKENKPPLPPKGVSNGFDSFWLAYPKKIGKGAAMKKWDGLKRLGRLPPLPDLIAAVERQKTWDQWQKDEGQYIPNPATWLNQSRWEDEQTTGGPQWIQELSKPASTN
jgi:hypothetical protein